MGSSQCLSDEDTFPNIYPAPLLRSPMPMSAASSFYTPNHSSPTFSSSDPLLQPLLAPLAIKAPLPSQIHSTPPSDQLSPGLPLHPVHTSLSSQDLVQNANLSTTSAAPIHSFPAKPMGSKPSLQYVSYKRQTPDIANGESATEKTPIATSATTQTHVQSTGSFNNASFSAVPVASSSVIEGEKLARKSLHIPVDGLDEVLYTLFGAADFAFWQTLQVVIGVSHVEMFYSGRGWSILITRIDCFYKMVFDHSWDFLDIPHCIPLLLQLLSLSFNSFILHRGVWGYFR